MASTRIRHAVAISLAAVLAFAGGVRGEFLADDLYIVQQRLEMPFASFWTDDYWAGYTASGLYRPLGLSWLWLQRQVFGAQHAAGFHLVSLVLHATASALFYLTAIPLAGESIAVAAALLFAVHPVHAEAVLPAYGQLDLLAAVLVLTAMLACRGGRHLGGVLALGAAMLVKESAFAGLGLLWLAARPSWRVLAGYGAVTLAAGAVRFGVLGSLALPADATVIGPDASWTLWAKSVVIAVAHAVRLLVWPSGQTVYYGHLRDSLMGFPAAELTWLATAAMVAGALWLILPRRDVLTGLGWFGICLLPVANVVPIGVLVAERSLYLAVGGVALLAARAKPVLLGAVALAAVAASWQVTWQWRTERSLWESTVAAHPRSPKAHAMVGWAALRELQGESGDHRMELLRQAEAAFNRALALNPGSSDARSGRAVLEWQRGGCEAARQDLDQAARATPVNSLLRDVRQSCGF